MAEPAGEKRKVLTANRLADGIAVWFGTARNWTEHFDAALAVGEDDVATLETAASAASRAGLVDLQLIDVIAGPQGLAPVRLRERIRALGPTIRTDLGKQAERGRHAA